MTKKILLYALIFMALLAIYQYVSMNKMYEKQSGKIEELRTKVESLKNDVTAYKDTTNTLMNENLDLSYFSLKNNGEALAYFDEYNFEDVNNLSQYITDIIYDQNSASKDNPLVPFDGMDGNFAIDKVKVINHKWVLCSFSDGTYWGEVLLSYEIDKDKTLSFETLSEVLYAKYEG
ncbi:hydrolase [Kordia sp. YSTF-M3]|uniref:Hydrolase n=1 Tax=Kordia aestuariivivens TaxID=2759037 RepID=A0ABR7QFT1_9FLAO|nr:hydrolase [Kordia aestuariivivens]MBC8757426.1 hydrolase [Kordia aestuariivivens]